MNVLEDVRILYWVNRGSVENLMVMIFLNVSDVA